MTFIQPHHHAGVRELVNLPENTRIGMTENDRFVSYGGTSFYLHPEQTFRVSRFIQSFPKVGADGALHHASRWQLFLSHVRAVFQGVKASSFIKRCSRDQAAPPLAKPNALMSDARVRFDQAINVVLAVRRFSDAGARAAVHQTTAQPGVSASTRHLDVPANMPATALRAKASNLNGVMTLRTVAPTHVTQARRPPPPTTLKLHRPLTGTSDAQTWTSAPQLTVPANRRITS